MRVPAGQCWRCALLLSADGAAQREQPYRIDYHSAAVTFGGTELFHDMCHDVELSRAAWLPVGSGWQCSSGI